MNFGVRLPGPFRVGVSSSGRINAGVTLGPLSASTNLGGSRPAAPGEVFGPVHILDALAAVQDEGWKIKGRGDDWAVITKGLTTLRLETVRGGTAARRLTNPWKVLIWMTLVTVAVFACMGWLNNL